MARKEPSKAELDKMQDFGEYVSWILAHNKKPEAKKKDGLYKAETKKLAGKKKGEAK